MWKDLSVARANAGQQQTHRDERPCIGFSSFLFLILRTSLTRTKSIERRHGTTLSRARPLSPLCSPSQRARVTAQIALAERRIYCMCCRILDTDGRDEGFWGSVDRVLCGWKSGDEV